MPLSSPRWLARRARPKRTNRRHTSAMLAAATVLVAVTITGAGRPPEPAYSAVDPALVDVGGAALTQPLIPGDATIPLSSPAAAGALLGFGGLFPDVAASGPDDVEAEAGDGDVCISSPLVPGGYRITSKYGMRSNPFSGRYMLHAGTDLAAPFGTPIHVVADGVVSYTGPGRAGRSSELVIVDHEVDGKKFSSWYVHMYPDGVFVKAGQRVRAGEVIAEVGSNGNSTGPHLHLEIHAQAPVSKGKGTSVVPRMNLDPAAGDLETTGLETAAAAGDQPSSTNTPSQSPSRTEDPTEEPTDEPTDEPTEEPTDEPTDEPTEEPTDEPTDEPTEEPTDEPTDEPSDDPSKTPSPSPSTDPGPSESPSKTPKPSPSGDPTDEPSDDASEEPTDDPSEEPTEDARPRTTGYFDPATGGYTTDPLAFLEALGYGLASPSVCLR